MSNNRPPHNRRPPPRNHHHLPSSSSSAPPPPPAHLLPPGTPVSIVQKHDQPTGRQVQGLVAELLTRDARHPRGVKVRLVDGRVGRVQRLAGAEECVAAEAEGQRSGAAGSSGGSGGGGTSGGGGGMVKGRARYGDVREDGFDYESRPGAGRAPSLEDYMVVKPARRKKGRRGVEEATVGEEQKGAEAQEGGAVTAGTHLRSPSGAAAAAVCPVCNDFTGDEEAVAHHVASHF